MAKRIYIARPRLDCSFKEGNKDKKKHISDEEGAPLGEIRVLMGQFIDRLADYHIQRGDTVDKVTRPLWQFDLQEMQEISPKYDVVYFPHKLKRKFPIGKNALYYKSSTLAEYITVDPEGWGAALSFLPVKPTPTKKAWPFYEHLRNRISSNQSTFPQPSAANALLADNYLLFVCQIPHDENILYQSDVTVEQALAAVIEYARETNRTLIVKGHPVNPRSMAPLKALAGKCELAHWVDDVSIHTCLAGADRVFLVNSGVGFEAMFHGKTVVSFGRAEYSNVVVNAEPTIESLKACENETANVEDYANFLYAFFQKTIRINDPASYERVLPPLIGNRRKPELPLFKRISEYVSRRFG